MLRWIVATVVLALTLMARAANADPVVVHVVPEIKSGVLIFGARRPTGGWASSLEGRGYIGDDWGPVISADLEVIDPQSGWHWVGVLGKPGIGIWGSWLQRSLFLSAVVSADIGRISIVNEWGFAARYYPIIPELKLRAQYRAPMGAAVGAELGTMYVRAQVAPGYPPAWEGVVFGLRAVGSWQ